MLNHIVIMGRLTKAPELRRTQQGTAVASFTLAVERDVISKETGKREADFINVVAWNGAAEFVDKYFSKGQLAVVSGRLQIREWTNKDGEKRWSTEVMANSVYFAESKKPAETAPEMVPVEDDGELPF